MEAAKNVLLFLIKLPFRFLAIPVVLLLFGVEGVFSAVKLLGGFIIGLYNILLLFILIMIVKDQNWAQMWQFGILVLVEGVALGVGGFVYAIIGLIRDTLMSFAITGRLEYIQ